MKRIISIALTVVMLLSAMGTLAFAEETAPAEEVIEVTADAELYASVKEEAGLAKVLGIMKNVGEDNIKAKIPRGEFIEHVLRFMGHEPAKSAGVKQYFVDVPEGSAYYDAVTTAAMIGLINGNGEGYFLPEQNIKLNEAFKMLLCALDYGAVAEARGGYPMGYVAVARDLKLEKGISLSGNDELDNANAVKLIFNALNANSSSNFVTSENTLTMGSSNILHLEDAFMVTKHKGVVTATQVTRQLEGKEYIGFVEIDNKEYEVIASEYFDEEDLLGLSVYFYVQHDEYVKEDPAEGKIIMISPMDDRNTVIDVFDEDISEDTSVTSFKYWDKNDNITAKDISDAVVYYNGRNSGALLNPDGSDLRPEYGKVRLIDNDRNRKIDYVLIESYNEYVVEYGATTKIVTKYGGPTIELGDRDDVIIVRDGVVITADFLGEWESLKVMAPKQGGMYIKVSGDKVNGIITTFGDEEIKLGEVVYEYADVYKNALEAKHYQAQTDKKGAVVTVAVNEDNKVVGMVTTVTEITEYGYLVKAVAKGGLDPINQVKIYCMYGSMNIFDCADNLKINGYKLNGSILEHSAISPGGVFKDQLIRYTLKNGVVTAIYTADEIAEERTYYPASTEEFKLNYKRTESAWTFVSGTNVLEQNQNKNGEQGAYVITTDMIPTFWIPKDVTEESLFKFYETASSINGLNKQTTELYVYDATLLEPTYNVFTPGALVVKDTTDKDEISENNPYILSSISNSAKYHVVDIIETTLDGSGQEVYQITTVEGTVIGFEPTVYNVDTTSRYGDSDGNGYGALTLGELEQGDVIQVEYGNDAAKANRFVVIARASDYSRKDVRLRWWTNDRADNTVNVYAGPGTQNALVIGEIIYENHPTYVVRTINEKGENESLMLSYAAVYPSTTGRVYIYERGSKKAFIATSNQLAEGKNFVMQIRNNGYMGNFVIIVTD